MTALDIQPQLFTVPELPHNATIEERFIAFDQANPWVYVALVRLARQLVKKGHTKVGMKMLFEQLRWEWYVTTTDTSGFRLNNNYTAFFARKIMANEPDLADLFETRVLRAA